MAMAMRQARRQLQFTGFEMALIAVSFLITVTTVFFLGLFVGKKNASYHAPAEDRVARVPVDDFTRYKRPAPLTPVAKAEPKAAAAEAEVAAAPVAAARTPAAHPGAAEGKAASVPASAPAAAPVADAAAKVAAVPGAPGAAVTADAAAKAKEAAAKEEAARLAAAKAKEEKAAEAETGRGYTVQILATRKAVEADALVKKLKSRGYAAYIKKMSDGEGAWYRVRVGSYGAFSEARVMADKCRRDLGLGQAFVSTE